MSDLPSPLPGASTGAELDVDLESALDSVFTDRPSGEPTVGTMAPNSFDAAQTRELFAGIAANYSRPIKDFIYELREGTPPKEWIDVCRPVISSLKEAANSMEYAGIAKFLTSLDHELEQCQGDRGPWPSKAWRERVLFLYGKLEQIQPDAFTVETGSRQRESIIVHSLLRQVPEVGYVSLEKLYRIGLTSRETLFQATASDLVSTAGIPLALATRICEEVQSYRKRTSGSSEESLRKEGRDRLLELVPELRGYHDAYKSACLAADLDRSVGKEKRRLRTKRKECTLEIEVTLAEMGEVALAREVQALSFDRRLNKLESYLTLPSKSTQNANTGDEEREPAPIVVGK